MTYWALGCVQKAFDTVNHRILLKKLDGCSSFPLAVACVVLQGSVLGPLLSLIYVDDIGNGLPFKTVKLYADDTNLFITACTVVYKLLYKPWPCQWERAIFDPHSSETPGPIFMKLEIYNYFQDTTPHAQFQGPMSTWVVWANSQFDAWKFLSFFFVSSPRPQVAFLDTSALNTSLYVVPAKEVPIGG